MSISMGLTSHHNNVVFVRKFRWTVESQSGSMPGYLALSVGFNWVKKEISLSVYETLDQQGRIPILDWIDNLKTSTESLIFKTWDGCGDMLYELQFNDIKLVSQLSAFDYSLSDVSTQDLILTYENVVRREPERKESWELQIGDETMRVRVKEKPSVKIEETKINHLNSVVFIPGKTECQEMEIWFEGSPTIVTKPVEAVLSQLKGQQVLTRWKLSNVTFLKYDGEKNSAKLRFSGVELIEPIKTVKCN